VLMISLRIFVFAQSMIVLRSLHGCLHATVGHVGHAVGVGVDIELVGVLYTIEKLANALRMADWAVFVAHEKRTETSDLVVKLADLLVQRLILCRVHFDLGLEIGQPLLLALTTFQGCNTKTCCQ
jgi:hypothetical protein